MVYQELPIGARAIPVLASPQEMVKPAVGATAKAVLALTRARLESLEMVPAHSELSGWKALSGQLGWRQTADCALSIDFLL